MSSNPNPQRANHTYADPSEKHLRVQLHYGDTVDASNSTRLIKKMELDDIYNLVSQRHVADHDMGGILIMKGNDIQQSIKVDAEAVDITLTLLYLHGLPVLEDMNGRIL